MYPIPYSIRHPYSIPYSTSVLKLDNRSTIARESHCSRMAIAIEKLSIFLGEIFEIFLDRCGKYSRTVLGTVWSIEIGDYGTKFDRLYVQCAMINCWWSSLPHAVNRLRILDVGRRKRWRSSVAQRTKRNEDEAEGGKQGQQWQRRDENNRQLVGSLNVSVESAFRQILRWDLISFPPGLLRFLLAFSIDSIPRVWTACASNPVNSAALVHYMLMMLMRRALLSMSEVRKNFTAWRDESFFFHWLLCLVSLDASSRWRVCAFETGSGILYRLFCHVSQRFCVEIWCKKKLVFSRVLKRISMPD